MFLRDACNGVCMLKNLCHLFDLKILYDTEMVL